MNKKILFVFLLASSVISFAQSPSFSYRRKLAPIQKDGWYSIALPAELFKQLNPGYSDLRLYQLNGTDTTEIPYLLKVRNDEVNEGVISLPVLNKSKKDGKLFLTFQLNREQSVNYLDLDFEERNFNGYVKFEGSNDQKEWFELVNKQRILSIENQDIDFKALTLNFPLTNYRFLRATISSDKSLTFKEATFRTREINPGIFNSINAKLTTSQDKKNKQTITEIRFNDFQPVSRLSVQINHTGDYYRSFSLESLRDSSQSPNKQWQYYYEPVYSGYLTSIEPNDFEFDVTHTKKMRLIVLNADNATLNVNQISTSGPRVELIAQLKSGQNFLFYGSLLRSAPSYDLVHFENEIPDSLNSIQLEKEEKLTPEKEKVSPLLENKLWLWVAMGAIIGLLGFGTLRMISKK